MTDASPNPAVIDRADGRLQSDDMAKTLEEIESDAIRQVLDELSALPPDYEMSPQEWVSYIRRLPKSADQTSSAEIIRELRGPLPEDDPDFPDELRR